MLCVRNIPRAKKFMDQRRAGEYQAFPSKIFCLTVPKDVIGRGGVSKFSVEKFLTHRHEKLRTRTLQCLTIFGYRKDLCSRGLFHNFLSTFTV